MLSECECVRAHVYLGRTMVFSIGFNCQTHFQTGEPTRRRRLNFKGQYVNRIDGRVYILMFEKRRKETLKISILSAVEKGQKTEKHFRDMKGKHESNRTMI